MIIYTTSKRIMEQWSFTLIRPATHPPSQLPGKRISQNSHRSKKQKKTKKLHLYW